MVRFCQRERLRTVTSLLITAWLLTGKIPSCPYAAELVPEFKEFCLFHKASSDPVGIPCTLRR